MLLTTTGMFGHNTFDTINLDLLISRAVQTSAGYCCTLQLDDCGVCGGTNQCVFSGTILFWTNESSDVTNLLSATSAS